MKTIIRTCVSIILILVLLFTLAGCNMGLGLGNFTFTHIHICDFNGNMSHAIIEKWYDTNSGIEVKTEEYGSIFLSEGTYVLYNDNCPICDSE